MDASAFFSSGPLPNREIQKSESEEFETLDINANQQAPNNGPPIGQPVSFEQSTLSNNNNSSSNGVVDGFVASSSGPECFNQEPEYEGVALQTALNTFTAVGRLGGGIATNVFLGGAVKMRQGIGSSLVGNAVGGNNNTAATAAGSSTKRVGNVISNIGNFASGLVKEIGGGEEDDEIARAMVQWAEERKRLQQNQQQGSSSGQQQPPPEGYLQEGYLQQENHLQQQQQQQFSQQQQQQQFSQQQQGYINNNSNSNMAQQVFSAPSPSNTPQFGPTPTTIATNATSTNVGPPAMSLGTSAAEVFGNNNSSSSSFSAGAGAGAGGNHFVAAPVSRMASDASAANVFGATNPAVSGNASAADVFGATNVATSENVSTAADVFGATNVAVSENVSTAADVFGTTNVAVSENVSTAADVFGTTNVAVSENASAVDVFGATNVATSENASAENFFGATNPPPSENVSTAADVFGTTNPPFSEKASAENVFGATPAREKMFGVTSTSVGTENASAADVFSANNTTTSENASAADVFGTSNVAAAENASAADVFAASKTTTSENASAADVFGTSNVSAAENASAADVFAASKTTASENASAANAFGTSNVSAAENASAADVFGASNPAMSENASAVNVFGTPSASGNPAEEVLGGLNTAAAEKTSAADVFGAYASNPTSMYASEVFPTEIPTTGETILTPPLPEGWFKGIDEASGNTYYYNNVTGESSWEMPREENFNAIASTTGQGNVTVQGAAVDTLRNTEEIKKEEPLQKQHPEIVHRQSSHQLNSLECAEHDPNFQYSDPLVGSAVAPSTSTSNANGSGISKPPVTGNVLAMEIGNYHPPTAMVTMMEKEQEVNVPASVDAASFGENVVEPNETVAMNSAVDATPETTVEETSIQHETPPLVASFNMPTTTSSPVEATEKHTISSFAPPEKRPAVATSNTHRRFQLNLPKKASLPLPPPRSKKTSSSVSGGGSLGSTSRKKKLTSSPFRKPPPMEVSATPRFHVPPPAGGSSVGSGGSGSHHHYPLPKATTPGATSVLTTSPLPTPRVLDDGKDDVSSSASPLLPATSTSAVAARPVVEKTTESEPKNAPPEVAAVSIDGGNASTEEPKVVEASTETESTPPVVFQPLELDQIVEAVAAAPEEFKMELPKKEVDYDAGEDIVNNVASTMAQEVMQDAVANAASTAISTEVPPPTYSLTTRPIYHEDEPPKAGSSLFTEGGVSDYQSTLRDEDFPCNTEDGEMLNSVEGVVAPTHSKVEAENPDAALDIPKKDEDRELSGVEAMVSSSVVTEYPLSDYQEQVTDEDFVVVESSDVDNNAMPPDDAVPTSSSWVETVDPNSEQTYEYNQESWQAAANEETVESTVLEASPEVSTMTAVVAESVTLPADDANESQGIVEDEIVVEPEVTEDEAPLLPEGWVKCTDEASGNTYYYNTITNESSWDFPSNDNAVAPTEQGHVAVDNAAVVALSNAEESNDSSKTDVNDDVHPRVEVEHEEVAQVNIEQVVQVNVDHNNSAAEGQVEEETNVEPEKSEIGSLPAGWKEFNDPSGRVFYYNAITEESSWERPKHVAPEAVEVSTPAMADDAEGEQPIASGEVEPVDEDVKAEENAQVQTNSLITEESLATLEDDECNLSFESLPPGWIETKDSASGKIYYYNEITEESCWERPTVAPETADGPAVNIADKVESEVIVESDIPVIVESDIPMPETVEESAPLVASINDEANIAVVDQEPVEEPRLSHETHSDLPVGWIEAVHEGNAYFYNEETGETSWSRPKIDIVDGLDEVDSPVDSALAPEESPEVTSTPQVLEDEIPEGDDADVNLPESHVNDIVEDPTATEEIATSEKLPPGWVSSIDEASGNAFYYNEETGESKWERPLAEVVDDGAVDYVSVEESATLESDVAGASEMKNGVDSSSQQPQADKAVEDNEASEETAVPSIDQTPLDDFLPPGWFSSVDESSGKTFYYNEKGGSSWEKPKVEVGDAASEDEEPVGQVGANETEATELEDDVCEKDETFLHEPEAVEELATVEDTASSEDELPEGWLSSIDETSGKSFYYNEETGESMWEKPSNQKALNASPEDEVPAGDADADKTEVSESEEVIDDANLEQLQSAEVVTDEPVAVIEDDEPITVEETASSDEGLPVGWSSSIDETSGKTFYYNEETGESTWEKPSIKKHDDDEPDDIAVNEVAVAETEVVVDNTNLDQLQSADVVTDEAVAVEGGEPVKDEEPITVEDASPDEELPEAWSSSIDETSGKTFYYNEKTGESTWEKPTIEGQNDDVPDDIAADDVSVAETEEVVDNANLDQVEVDEAVCEEPDAAVEDEEPAIVEETASPGEVELPEGWLSSIDETSGKTFYYNEETGESTWEKPSNCKVPDASPEEDVPANDIAAAEPEQVVDDVVEKPSPAEENPSLEESDELPPGWSSSVDEASGNIFYYNDEGITSWDKPSVERSPDQAETENEAPVDGVVEHQEEEADRTDRSVEPQGGETDMDLTTEETPKNGLPQGWREVQDEATGNVYYWNEETNETSWDYPRSTEDGDPDNADVQTEEKEASEQVGEVEYFSEQVVSDESDGDGAAEPQPNDQYSDLLEGWVATVDEASGNTYYYNEETNETSWDKPVAETKRELPSIATPKPVQRCRPAHAIATFGFGGRLCVMMPQVAAPLSGTVSQPSSSDHPTMRRGPVVIHRVKDLIPSGDKFSIPSSTDSDAVGPLVKAKEKDVMSFLKQKSASPENLIWNVMNIAAQNKGRLKNGDDVVDGGPEEAIVDLLLSVGTNEKSTQPHAPPVQPTNSDLHDVQDLLLRGDRDRAVVEALREKNYALALIIAAMCDDDIYQMVARQFADNVLSPGSPLYTATLLLTDNLHLPPKDQLRDPRNRLSFWCEDPYEDLYTNWTQQLATILSNKRADYTKIIMTLGDRLMQLGHCHAAHVCYLATSLSLNDPSKPSTRMVLLGCDHNVPLNRVLMTPEAIEAFERSEAFEWARRLGNKRTIFPSLQPFKLRYAELLADVGHEVLAREYLLSIRICTGIGIIKRAKGNLASLYDSSFIQSLRELDDRICGSIGAERSSWDANEESSKGSMFSLGRLSALVRGKDKQEEDVVTPRPESEADPLLELDTATPPAIQSQKEEPVPPAATKSAEKPSEPLRQTDAFNTSIGTSNNSDSNKVSAIDDAPASAPPSFAIGESTIDRADDSKANEEKLAEKLSTPSEASKKDEKKKAPASEPPVSAGLLARLFGRDKDSKVKVADCGEEMQAYYDEKLKRWIFPGDDPAEVAKPLAPPPIMKSSDKAPSTPAPAPAPSNDPLAALMAPPSRASTARKGMPPVRGMPPTMSTLASMGNMSTPGATMKKEAAPTPKFAVFQPVPTKSDPTKDEKENVAAS